jgi:hypothetical protein
MMQFIQNTLNLTVNVLYFLFQFVIGEKGVIFVSSFSLVCIIRFKFTQKALSFFDNLLEIIINSAERTMEDPVMQYAIKLVFSHFYYISFCRQSLSLVFFWGGGPFNVYLFINELPNEIIWTSCSAFD